MRDDGLGAETGETGTAIEAEPLSPVRWTGDPARGLLREKLEQRTSARLAGMYWQAIRAVGDPTNSERVAVAGHLLRLLQEELPDDLPDFPQVRSPAGLRSFFDALDDSWQALVRKTTSRDGDGRWVGTIDKALDGFLRKLERRTQDYKADYPRWKREQRGVLGSFDTELARVPMLTQEAVVDSWAGFHDVFTKVAHHGSMDVAEFEEHLRDFENFLGDRLVPRTFEKRARIAQLVREAEGHADG